MLIAIVPTVKDLLVSTPDIDIMMFLLTSEVSCAQRPPSFTLCTSITQLSRGRTPDLTKPFSTITTTSSNHGRDAGAARNAGPTSRPTTRGPRNGVFGEPKLLATSLVVSAHGML